MRERGVDISTIMETESLGGKFFEGGVQYPLLDILQKRGITSVRLRLWNDPFNEKGESYGAGCCDIETVLRTARRVTERGMSWMLDFHYSDFWADPGRQLPPKAWKGMDIEGLERTVYAYTKDILARCKKEGLYPKYVQIGNEITNGTLWPHAKVEYSEETGEPSSYNNLTKILKAGSKAARESGDTKIIFHLERSCDNVRYRHWFDAMERAGVDYDIIGVSYYPHWHGTMVEVKANLEDVSTRYDKDVMVVESSYPFTAEHYADRPGVSLVINSGLTLPDGGSAPYPFSIAGQTAFVKDLVSMVNSIERCKGLYYWEPAWLPVEGSTWSTADAREYISEQHKPGGNEWANQCLFDYKGNMLPAIEELTKIR